MSNTTSGTTGFSLTVSDSVIEAFDRIQVRPTQITTQMMKSARLSTNILLQEWSNKGVNLWKVSLLTIPMIQGVATYALPAGTIDMLDTYIRQYQLGAPVSLAAQMTTVLGSTTVTIHWPNHGLSVGEYMQVVIPVSVGGIVLQGFYQVGSVPDSNDFTVTVPVAATAAVTLGGQVPLFTTQSGSMLISVNLPNHGLLSGQAFNVQVSTIVGGLNIQGSYIVATVIDANNFTFGYPVSASSGASASENGGQVQYAGQVQNSQPTDIILYGISRTDYAMLPNKLYQGRPTSFWFDRTLSPTVTMWRVPDATQPYQLCTYITTQIQDAYATGAQTFDMPQRFFEALCSGLCAKLAEKYAPEQLEAKTALADKAWQLAAGEDREKVSTFIAPDFSGYFGY